MIAKGTVAEYLTEFLREFLSKCSMDELIVLLKKAKMEKRLMDFFPPEKRTPERFNQHFEDAELKQIVEYSKIQFDADRKRDMQDTLMTAINEETPVADVVKMFQEKKAAVGLSDNDSVKVAWTALMDSLILTGKNNQQVQYMVLKQIKTWNKLLATVAHSARLEAALMVEIQVNCYEDSAKLKLFGDIIRLLYDVDVIAEDTIHYWHKKGSSTKGRNVFMKEMEPFMKWLEEAEEEEDDD